MHHLKKLQPVDKRFHPALLASLVVAPLLLSLRFRRKTAFVWQVFSRQAG